ncbi:MAG: GAF domain-containing protein, partial [Candidatus Rokubacteria bacterium]|nr:GAF domain-containing protein [Candidatus Rokubacteria bacterium]
QLQTLNQLNRAISAALGSDQALHAIADAGARITGAALAAVCVVDQNAETLTVRAHVQDGSIERLAAPTFVVGSSAVGWVAGHRQTLNIPDVLLDDRIGYPAWWRAHGLTSFLGLPIAHEETLLGVLWLCGRRPFRVGPDTKRLLDCFVANAAVAIRNARLLAESEARRREAAALVEVGHLLSETLDPEVVGRRITDSVRDLFGTQSAALYRRDPESGDLVGLAGSGDAGPAFRPGIVMPRGSGMVGLAVRERGPVFTADLLSDPRVRLPADVRERIEAAPYRAVLAVPLVTKEQVIGALSIADGLGRAFGPEDGRLVEAFAGQAALALENARLYAEATQRAREAEELARVARTLTESLDVATVADRVVESATALFNVPSCGIRLVDGEDGSLVSAGTAARRRRIFPPGHVLPAGAGLSGRAVQEGKPLWSSDALAEASSACSSCPTRRAAASRTPRSCGRRCSPTRRPSPSTTPDSTSSSAGGRPSNHSPSSSPRDS